MRRSGLGGHADRPQRHAGRHQERPEEAVLQEAGQPARRVEQVERVAGGRGVDDHDVELLGVDQLVELLHGHVLLRARERAGEILVEPVGQDRLGLLRRAGVALHEVVERALGVEHQRVQVAGPVALHLRGRVGQRLHAEGVGQPPRRVDGDHAGAPAGPGRRQREGGRHRRLAHAARPAAHHHGPLGHQVGQRRRHRAARALGPPPPSAPGGGAHAAPSGTSAGTATASASASTWVSGRPDGGGVERRHEEVGQGQVPAQALDLLGRDGVAGQPEVPGLLERGQVVRRHGQAGRRGHLGRRAAPAPPGSGSQALTMTGPSWTPALSSRV